MIGATKCKEILYNLKLIDESNEIVTSESQKLKLLIDNCLWITKRRDSQPIVKKIPLGRREPSSSMNSMQGMFRLESDDLVLSSSNFGLNPDQFGSMHVQYSNYEQFVDSNSALSSKRIKNIANGNGTETGTGTSTGINDENTGDGYDFFNLNDSGYGNIEKKVIFFIICYFVNLYLHFFVFIFYFCFLFFIFYFYFNISLLILLFFESEMNQSDS